MDIFETTISEDPILKHLPQEIIHDPFWNQSHISRPSTFGATPKPNIVKVDDPYRIKKDHDKWVHYDQDCNHHGRLNVESLWGRYKTAPPPGEYNPDHEKLSKRESFPKHSILAKPRDRYFEQLKFAQKHPLSPVGNVDPFNPFNIKKAEKKDIKISELSKLNIDDMRKSLLPGPGQYQAKYEYGEKFAKPPKPFLKPRKPSVQPRQVLNFTTMEIIEDRHKKCDKSYDVEVDNVLKKSASYSLGVRRPLLNQREHFGPGPGDYNQKGFDLGSSTVLSSPVKKR